MSQFKYDHLSPSERKEYLLEVLGFTSSDVSRIRNGEVLLGEALQARINEVMSNPDDTTQCAIVCQNIRRDGVSYETMDATPYLEHIGELKARGGRFADDEPSPVSTNPYAAGGHGAYAPGSDPNNSPYSQGLYQQYGAGQYTDPYARSQYQPNPGAPAMALSGTSVFPRPILRYIARFIDQMAGKMIVNLIFIFILKISPVSLAMSSYVSQTANDARQSLLLSAYNILSIVVIYALEPLAIHFWGTTPGKLIFGIHILNKDGSKLSLGQACRRSLLLLIFGCGFHLPFLRVFALVMSYNRCKRGEVMRWDAGLRIDYPDYVAKRNVIPAVATTLGIGIVTLLCVSIGNIVPNRGEITEEQFYENCRHVIQYEGITFPEIPDYVLTTDENGYVTQVQFISESEGEDRIYPRSNEMYVAFLAFVSGRRDLDLTRLSTGSLTSMFSNSLSDFTADFAGVTLINKIESVGYSKNATGGYLYESGESEEHSFRQVFTLTK